MRLNALPRLASIQLGRLCFAQCQLMSVVQKKMRNSLGCLRRYKNWLGCMLGTSKWENRPPRVGTIFTADLIAQLERHL